MMGDMRGRVLVGAGVGAVLVALVGLGGYFVVVGLEKADKLASVIAAFVAVVGLGVTVLGLVTQRRHPSPPEPSGQTIGVQINAEASGPGGTVFVAGGDQIIQQ